MHSEAGPLTKWQLWVMVTACMLQQGGVLAHLLSPEIANFQLDSQCVHLSLLGLHVIGEVAAFPF